MRTKHDVITEVENFSQYYTTLDDVDWIQINSLIKDAGKYQLKTEICDVYCNLINIIYFKIGDKELVDEIILKCHKVLSESDDKYVIIRFHSLIGNILREEGNYTQAIQWINYSNSLIELINPKDDKILTHEFYNNFILSLIYMALNELPKSKYYLFKSEKIALKLKNIKFYAKCLSQKGYYYCNLMKINAAEDFLKQAIEILETQDDQYEKANAIFKLAELNYKQKNYELANSNYIKAYTIMSMFFPNRLFVYELLRIAESFFELKQLNEAEKFFHLALEKSNQSPNKDLKIIVLRGVCKYYSYLGNYKLMVEYRDKIDIILTQKKEEERTSRIAELEEKYLSSLKQKEIDYRIKKQRDTNKYLKLLKQKNDDLAHFSYALAHDLREPIRTTKSFINIIANDIKKPEYFNFVSLVNNNLDRMNQLLNDILSLSKLDFEEDKDENIDMNELIEEIKENLGTQIEEKNAIVTYSKLPLVKAPKNQLLQLFQNLISNGIKYNKRQPKIEIKYMAELKGKGGFSIQDNGIGIPSNKQSQIFGLFKRLHGKEFQGTGIGLAICKKIVEKRKGEIWFESKENEGTTFYVRLNS